MLITLLISASFLHLIPVAVGKGVEFAASNRLIWSMCQQFETKEFGVVKPKPGVPAYSKCYHYERGCDVTNEDKCQGSINDGLGNFAWCKCSGACFAGNSGKCLCGVQEADGCWCGKANPGGDGGSGGGGGGGDKGRADTGAGDGGAGAAGAQAGGTGAAGAGGAEAAGATAGGTGAGGAEAEGSDSTKVINGGEAIPHIHPYVAYVQIPGEEIAFHATIWNEYTLIVNSYHLDVIMAAVNNDTNIFRIYAGKHNNKNREVEEQLRFVCTISKHPKNENNGPANQLYVYGIIHLYEPLTLNKFVDTIPMGMEDQRANMSKTCVLPGWGEAATRARPDKLNEAVVNITDCGTEVVDANEICGTASYCWGDSGTPLICTDKASLFCVALGSATGRDVNQPCNKKLSIFALTTLKDLHEWIQAEYLKKEAICRPSLSADG